MVICGAGLLLLTNTLVFCAIIGEDLISEFNICCDAIISSPVFGFDFLFVLVNNDFLVVLTVSTILYYLVV